MISKCNIWGLSVWRMNVVVYVCVCVYIYICRSQWTRGIRGRFVAARLRRLWVRILPGAWMSVCVECCVLSGRVLCDGLISRPEESYRMWCVVVCDLETSRMRRPWPALGRSATEEKYISIFSGFCSLAFITQIWMKANTFPTKQKQTYLQPFTIYIQMKYVNWKENVDVFTNSALCPHHTEVNQSAHCSKHTHTHTHTYLFITLHLIWILSGSYATSSWDSQGKKAWCVAGESMDAPTWQRALTFIVLCPWLLGQTRDDCPSTASVLSRSRTSWHFSVSKAQINDERPRFCVYWGNQDKFASAFAQHS